MGELAFFNPKEKLPDVFEYVDLESVVGIEMLSHRTEEKATAPSRAQRLAHTGDLFYQTVRPYQKNNYLFEKPEKHYVFSTGYAQLRPLVDGYFLLSLVQNGQFVKTVLDNCTGTNYPAINANDLAEIDVFYPKDEHEHHQIGEYFRHLDNIIILHQQKITLLTKLKKAMLEKMFPKKGTVIPEIRFNGFANAWEQRKFSELYARSSEKNDGSIGMDKNITVAIMQFKNDVKVSTTEYLKTYYTFKLGDIAFEGHQSKEFRYGRFVENDIGNGIVSHIFAVFRPIQEYDLYFWKYAINNEALMQRILARSTKASTMMHDLVTNDFLNETFLVPSVKEQKQIGAFLNKLDNLITLHQRKLDMLKKLKSACLSEMFI
ncbi:restriction endonuclease subunit S [Lactobacillus ruminis]|uniref:Restriction endonuclease subunit S n=2 Tax=Ligilactobacillus ruminis TaxID=1623 RepID=A0A6A8H315_9LACO|nr:restriction endonuclease subunit S [Ligilactobacillus ruminis]MSA35637.1 restriction endonuclease subunit S [Ligilactobacillus ruminis]MSA69260.1 restriction endonuclease subunit S [Ligilactobacillus ruminis]